MTARTGAPQRAPTTAVRACVRLLRAATTTVLGATTLGTLAIGDAALGVSVLGTRVLGTRVLGTRVLGTALLSPTALAAQPARPPLGDPNAERRARAGIYLEPGWHPYLAVGPAFPLGRLGDLTSLGVSGHLGAWYIRPDARWAGIGVEAAYASFAKDTDEPLPGRYQVAGVLAQITSKGKQRLFFDWLGGYGAVGVGAFRHGASSGTMRTAPGVSGSLGMLVPLAGYEGFVETRVQHVFGGETLGRGNGLTFAPLRVGVRF